MSELKCPKCGGRLVYWGATGALLKCSQCNFGWGNEELWQALIDTNKKLDICVDALKKIDDTRSVVKENLYASYGKSLNSGNVFCWTTPDEIHNTLEQINNKEQ